MEAQYGGSLGSSVVLALIYLVHKWHVALESRLCSQNNVSGLP